MAPPRAAAAAQSAGPAASRPDPARKTVLEGTPKETPAKQNSKQTPPEPITGKTPSKATTRKPPSVPISTASQAAATTKTSSVPSTSSRSKETTRLPAIVPGPRPVAVRPPQPVPPPPPSGFTTRPPVRMFDTMPELKEYLNQHGRDNGYAVCTIRSAVKDGTAAIGCIYHGESRQRKPQSNETEEGVPKERRKRGSAKCACPFRIQAFTTEHGGNGRFTFLVMEPTHNHPAGKRDDLVIHNKMSPMAERLLIDCLYADIPKKNIAALFRRQFPEYRDLLTMPRLGRFMDECKAKIERCGPTELPAGQT